MYYFSIFSIAGRLRRFISDSMVDMGRRPSISSIEIMLWRLSKTEIGSDIIDAYLRAQKDPSQWRDAVALILQGLSPTLKTVNLCALKASGGVYGKLRLSDHLSGIDQTCQKGGYLGMSSLLDYIEECRNTLVHCGVVPYEVESKSNKVGLSDFVKIGLEYAGENVKFEALCNLILASLCFYFDSLKPNYSKFSFIRQAALRVCMTVYDICKAIFTAIFAVCTFCYVSVYIGARLLAVLAIIAVVLVVMMMFKSCTSAPRQDITQVDPDQLVEWVGDMTPYQQMMFMHDRKSALNALGLYHAVGDEPLSPADRRTDELYEEFKSYPDPDVHYLSYLPNPGRLSRLPVLRSLYEHKWGGDKIFTKRNENQIPMRVDYLPIYQGYYYPVCTVSKTYGINKSFDSMVDGLVKYPAISVMLLYSSGNPDQAQDYANLAEQIKAELVKRGVSARRITILADPTTHSLVTVAVGNVPYYSGQKAAVRAR